VLQRIDHIGVAVRSIDEAAEKFKRLLGLEISDREAVEDQQIIAALVPTHDVRFELMQPTSTDSVVGRFLERRGEGIHHICFEVDDIGAEIAILKSKNVQLIQGTPRAGFVGLVEFIHPRSAAGILVEIAQVTRRTPTATNLWLRALTIASTDINAASDMWKRNLALVDLDSDTVTNGSVGDSNAIRLDSPNRMGTAVVEFTQPTDPQSQVGHFIETTGQGVFSVTLSGLNVEMRQQGKQLTNVKMIHPDQLMGVRIALEQS